MSLNDWAARAADKFKKERAQAKIDASKREETRRIRTAEATRLWEEIRHEVKQGVLSFNTQMGETGTVLHFKITQSTKIVVKLIESGQPQQLQLEAHFNDKDGSIVWQCQPPAGSQNRQLLIDKSGAIPVPPESIATEMLDKLLNCYSEASNSPSVQT